MEENKKAAVFEKKTSIIVYLITVLILFVESLLILVNIFRRGLYRKQILSKKSTIGYDIKIYMK